jgi:hypothetical protein
MSQLISGRFLLTSSWAIQELEVGNRLPRSVRRLGKFFVDVAGDVSYTLTTQRKFPL